ncbi:PP2C family protein-serine/threonine phosphatase [Parafrankia sp. EUN1f]|uniref:PP2C family protein-serine/threonine phosphatase n=1 Tax=Parafrankia sp. EUN1f TaxID=102897 RepID=UPI0001C47091|nr:PP2C family protein-serine/threonine phosphatase [Parafrankia sp. EUN1f]EFC80228.1 protein serine/threonine phosphatase [Parafrankia sp. EUN1f]
MCTATYQMLSSLLELGRLAVLEQLPALVREQAEVAGLADTRIYLVDLQGQVLRELTGHGLDAGAGGETIPVEGTLPGRVFQGIRTLPSRASASEARWVYWTPLIDGTERLGVLKARVVDGENEALAGLGDLAALIGLLLVSKREFSDSFARLVRTRPMTIAAELQWHLMPPTSFANQNVVVGAGMEPAYEIGGDAFDYAMAADVLHLAVFDAMGHDASAGLAANLAVATCRNQRRQGRGLVQVGQEIERMLIDQFDPGRYVTAVLADLDTSSGLLSWVNHGHHPPVIIRGGRWVSILSCPPAHPLGTDLGLTTTLCQEQLEPGDRLLLYTDGVIEARDPTGRQFGLTRFVDFVVRHHADGLAVPETLRRLMRALLDYHHGRLQDDATVLFAEWAGAAR